jgi:steroid Delta-isomerase
MPGPLSGPERRARAHAERFNAAVVSGDWSAFARWFAPDASLRFTNAPVPPAYGRDAILAAYDAHPPDETLRVLDAAADPDRPDVDVVRFAWASGDPGTMRIRWRDELVAELEVTFG